MAKKHCIIEGADGAGTSKARKIQQRRLRQLATQDFGGTQIELLPHFQATNSTDEGLTQFLVAGDLELPPFTPDVAPLVPLYSPTVGVTYPIYFLPILVSSSDDSKEEGDAEDPD